MSGQRKRIKEYIGILENLPVEVTGCEPTRSCHYKLYLEHAGQRRFFVCAGSPSDRRCLRNFRSEVAKWIREVDNGEAPHAH